MPCQEFGVYVVAVNRDGVNIHEFNILKKASIFCTQFLEDNKDYGGEIHAFQGTRLSLRSVEVATVQELFVE